MSKKDTLVYRARINLVLDKKIIAHLRKLSADTDAPISRLVERAVREVYKIPAE